MRTVCGMLSGVTVTGRRSEPGWKPRKSLADLTVAHLPLHVSSSLAHTKGVRVPAHLKLTMTLRLAWPVDTRANDSDHLPVEAGGARAQLSSPVLSCWDSRGSHYMASAFVSVGC